MSFFESAPLLAQASTGIEFGHILRSLLAALVFSVLGIAVFGLGFALILKMTPFSVRKEIEEDQNIALAILIGSMILGVSIIIAAAIHG